METEAEMYKLRQVKDHGPLQKLSKGRGTDSLLEPPDRKWFCRQISKHRKWRQRTKRTAHKGVPHRVLGPPGVPPDSQGRVELYVGEMVEGQAGVSPDRVCVPR